MRFNTLIRAWIGTLVGLTLVVVFAGIALLARTGPAIRQILADNEASQTACETMLAVLASTPGEAPPSARRRYRQALARAQRNVTHPDEQAPLAELVRLAPATLAQSGPARRRSVALLSQVAAINRAEMERKDRRAQRLASAGSWALVVLGLISVLLGILGFRSVLRRVVVPLHEVATTLAAARAGDPHRRAHVSEAPSDLAALVEHVNALLDRLPVTSARLGERESAV